MFFELKVPAMFKDMFPSNMNEFKGKTNLLYISLLPTL